MTLATSTDHLVARTVEIAPTDPVAAIDRIGADGFVWQHSGLTIATTGRAVTVPADAADAALAAIAVDDRVGAPGSGPIAVGALPFADSARGLLTVPRRVIGRDADGRCWQTDITADPSAAVDPAGFAPGSAAGQSTTHERTGAPWPARIRPLATRVQWDRAVAAALEAIAAGELEKVVLARAVVAETATPIDPLALLAFLAAREPDRYLFATAHSVGASPELLIARRGAHVTARPLAGSSTGPEAAAVDALARSAKDRHEHAVVVEGICSTLRRLCGGVDVGATVTLGLADIAHLATPITATAGAATPSALGLALALHPTAAVGGEPTARALEHIAAFEGDRGAYAAPVGWVDARGDGEFAVAIRSAQLVGPDGTAAIVRAGAGIVAGSRADREWDETETKLGTVLRAFSAR